MAGGVRAWSVFGELGLRGLGRTQSQLAGFDAAGRRAAGSVLGLSRSTLIAASGVGVLTSGLALSIGTFASFDAKMTQSLAIMGDVSEALRRDMSLAARQMARTTVFSAGQAAESYFFLASAGLDAKSSIQALPIVASFAQAGMFDMARATDLLTDAQSALGLTIRDDAVANMENMARLADILVKANTLANASVEQFAEALTNKAAARMRVLNVRLEEGVAVLAAFADQGVKASLAGERFNIVLRDLPDAALKNEEAFRSFNIRVFNADGTLRSLVDIIRDFERAVGGLPPQLQTAAFQQLGLNKRAQDGITSLLGTSEAIRNYTRALEDAQGVTAEVANKQLNTLSKQFGLLGSKIKDLLLVSGEAVTEGVGLTGVLERINAKLEEIIRRSQDMREFQRTLDAISGAGVDLERVLDSLGIRFGRFSDQLTVTPTPENIARLNQLIGLYGSLDETIRQLLVSQGRFFAAQPFQPQTGSGSRALLPGAAAGIPPPPALNLPERGTTLARFAEIQQLNVAEATRNRLLEERAVLQETASRELAEALRRERASIEERIELERQALFSVVGFDEEAAEKRREIAERLASLIATNERRIAQESAAFTKEIISNIQAETTRLVRQQAQLVEDNARRLKALREREADLAVRTGQVTLDVRRRQLESERRSLEDRIAKLRELGVVDAQTTAAQIALRERLVVVTEGLLAVQNEQVRRAIAQAQQLVVTQGRRAGVEFLRNFAAGQEELSPEAQQALNKALEGMTRNLELERFVSDFKSIGRRFIDGLVQGTLDAKSLFKAALSTVIRAGLSFLTGGLLGIFSPSRVTRGIGRNITLGLVEGILDERATFARAFEQVLEPITRGTFAGGIRSAVGGISGAAGATLALAGGLSVNINVSGLTPPRTPSAAARDAEWQELLRETRLEADFLGIR